MDVNHPGCTVADICSPTIANYIPQNVDAIVHFAALSLDPDCRDNAYRCFDANVMGPLNLIQAAKSRDAKQFIFASSEWVYDRFEEGVPKTEDDVIDISRLTSEYALSKLVSEANLRQKYSHGFCATTILRFGIIYGPRPANWSAVESLLHAVATQDEVTVGSLGTGRRFIHVSDIAAALIASVSLDGFNIINIQGSQIVTLGDIIETARKLVRRDPVVTEKTPNQVSLRTVSDERAKRLLGWQAAVQLEDGLRSVLEFIGRPVKSH